MHRFFGAVVGPLLSAAAAQRVIEIGAGTGQQTAKLARWCSRSGATLDIIDPAPEFDTSFLSRWAGLSRLHQALSVDVLADLLPADVVLVDGDHNWYTVFHEMRLLFGDGDTIPENAPIAVCHDVDFPYGRRDLYYDIETIPAAYRQPAGPGALNPLYKGFAPAGLNTQACHARVEGGPRNGVRTAIEDALRGREDQLRIVSLPLLYGLSIIAPRARLAARPALAALLDELDPGPKLRMLMKYAEQERIQGVIAYEIMASLKGADEHLPAPAADLGRPFTSALGPGAWKDIQRGVFSQRYKGRKLALGPFDMANYLQLIGDMRPGCVIEVGAYEGGRALWLADAMAALGLPPKVISIDLVPPKAIDAPGVTFLEGDASRLGDVLSEDLLAALPRPLLVIEDSAHTREAASAVLEFFDPHLGPGDYIVIEDGVIQTMMEAAEPAGVSRAVLAFLGRRGGDYEIDTSICDRFGYNATHNPNGWLRRR